MPLPQAFLCDSARTPFGRYGGALATVRADDLAALPIRALIERNPRADWQAVDDVVFGCANQAGEDNRNVARMALLLAGLPEGVPGVTVNRLCGSSLEAIAVAARAIRSGEISFAVAGGVESMSRAPYVLGKAESPFARSPRLEDSTLGWRFVNPAFHSAFGTDSMAETAENVAARFSISRAAQDAFACRSQQRAAAAQLAGVFAEEIVPVSIVRGKGGDPVLVSQDEHLRPGTTEAALSRLQPVVRPDGTVTAGNASGINDGAGAMIVANEEAIARHHLRPVARIVASAVAGVAPRVMGIGPVPASRRALALAGLALEQVDIVELNEAFAAQALGVLRELGLADDAAHINPHGGAIALGHPLGASGARLAMTAARQLERGRLRYALCTMCIGVGQGIAVVLERAG